MSARSRDAEIRLCQLHQSCIDLAHHLRPDGYSFVIVTWEGDDVWFAAVGYRDGNAWQEEVGEGEGRSLIRALESLEGHLEDALIERRDELAS